MTPSTVREGETFERTLLPTFEYPPGSGQSLPMVPWTGEVRADHVILSGFGDVLETNGRTAGFLTRLMQTGCLMFGPIPKEVPPPSPMSEEKEPTEEGLWAKFGKAYAVYEAVPTTSNRIAVNDARSNLEEYRATRVESAPVEKREPRVEWIVGGEVTGCGYRIALDRELPPEVAKVGERVEITVWSKA